tara:strand:+ start:403 stop:603 length:201 start_codon:yes stop_codon:yes gene_type:complete
LKKKKPTNKDIEIVVSNLIKHLQVIEQKVNGIDNLFGMYIRYKKDEKSFQKYIKKQIDLASDDRDK